MRSRVGDDFFLTCDCWIALTVEYTLPLIEGLRPLQLQGHWSNDAPVYSASSLTAPFPLERPFPR